MDFHIDEQSPIGVFDSGIGGLTVARALQQSLPNETLCYFGDTARVPYGTKSAETVTRYSEEITRFLWSHGAKMIVVACNTASSLALEATRALFPGPVLGVVEPGVRAALRATRSGRIGVIGTRSTIESGAYQGRLQAERADVVVRAQACPLFVPLAEEGWTHDAITRQTAERYLSPLRDEGVDVLILGCTHFPLLADVISEAMGPGVVLVNSAEEVACEVEQRLMQGAGLAAQKHHKDLFYASDDIAGFERLYYRICGDAPATFQEAPSDFFAFVQDIYRYRKRLFLGAIPWFEPLEEAR